MPSYLLTWNPKKWQWDEFDEEIHTIEDEGSCLGQWSCGNSKRIRQGDRLFLLRQGVEPRGLIASGWALSDWFEDEHWGDSSGLGRKTHYVKVEWDSLSRIPIISRSELDQPPFAGGPWKSQSSGVSIPASIARDLEAEWGRRTGSRFEFGPDEVLDADAADGFGYPIVVNALERFGADRAKCIEHYGYRCSVCTVSFDEAYGPLGDGLIFVHHLRPIDELSDDYRVDPIEDLRPICANCHAVIHRREPPLSLEELSEIIDKSPWFSAVRTSLRNS
jgi:5-methylcytosine-specific restriction enzyme A